MGFETEFSCEESVTKPRTSEQKWRKGAFKSKWNSLHVELIQRLNPLELKYQRKESKKPPTEELEYFNTFLQEMADKDDIIVLV